MNPLHQKRINYFVGALVILAFALGVYGWFSYFQSIEKEMNLSTAVFLTLQMFAMNTGFEDVNIPLNLDIARFLAPLSLASAIISLIASATNKNLIFAKALMGNYKPIIICGLSRQSLILAQNLRHASHRQKVYVIDPEPDAVLWEEASRNSIVVIKHEYTSGALKSIGLARAELLLLNSSDSENLGILGLSCLKSTSVKVIVNISNPATYERLKEVPSGSFGNAQVYISNFEQIMACQITDMFSPDRFVNVAEDSPAVHILLAGDNPLVLTLLEEFARMCHFANLKPLHITLLCPETESMQAEVVQRQPLVEKVVRIRFVALHDFQTVSTPFESDNISLCIVAFNNASEGIQTAFRLRQHFYALNQQLQNPYVLLLNPLSDNVPELIPGFEGKLENLCIHYHDTSALLTREVVVEDLERYDIIAKFINNSFSAEVLQDFEQADKQWALLSPGEKDYNRFPARHFHIKLRALGLEIVPKDDPRPAYDLAQVSDDKRLLLARIEKNRWNAEKFLTGFVPGTYNDDKDLEKFLKKELKCHAALKTWEQISQEEKDKDFFAFNNIANILAHAGLKIVNKTKARA